MLRPYAGGDPSCNAGDDRYRISRLDRRLALLELPDVAVVHVHVHEATQAPVVRKQVLLQSGVLPGELFQQLADVARFELDGVTTADIRPQRCGNQNGHCHTAFRSSMVIDSSSNPWRSSARVQLFISSARPARTPTITYESHGHAWSRSNAEDRKSTRLNSS